jgi:hypothetical protein
MTIGVRDYVYLAAILILVGAFIAWSVHERDQGKTVIEKQDTVATQKLDATTQVETQALQTQSDKAAEDASNAQAIVDSYVSSHPLAISLCSSDHRSPVLSQAAPAARQPSSSSPKPSSGPEVPRGSQGRDISPELGTVMSAFERLAIQDRQWQTR